MGVLKFMTEGGFFMWPILAAGLVGLVILVQKFIYLYQLKALNQGVWEKMLPLLQAGELAKLHGALKNNNSEISRVIEPGLAVALAGGDMGTVESNIEEGMLSVLPKLEARTGFVAVLANVATLLGLLGTVQGLIVAFKSVANADPALKGDLLSGAISVAMNTTAFGLGMAIPLILGYTFLQNYTQQVVESIEMISIKVQNQIRNLNKA